MKSGRQISCHAVQIYATGRSLRGIHSLRQQSQDPHVLQDAQWLSAADGRQTFVAYSLGNFLSTQNRPDQLVGAILNLQLQKTTEPDGTVQCAVLEPKLLPTVTHYDAGKSNVRTYLFRDYTQELAKQHGVRAEHSDFSLDTVQKIAQNNINSDFLELT